MPPMKEMKGGRKKLKGPRKGGLEKKRFVRRKSCKFCAEKVEGKIGRAHV